MASSNRQSAESDLQTALKDQTSSPERITMLKARLRAADEALSGIAGKLGVPFQANNPVYADLTPQQYRQAQHQLDLGKTLDSASTAMQRTPAGAQLYATLQKKREEGNLTDDDLAQVVQYSDNDGLAAQVKDAYATGKLNTARRLLTLLKNKPEVADGDVGAFLKKTGIDSIDATFADPASKDSVQADELDAQVGIQNDATRTGTTYTGALTSNLGVSQRFQSYDAVSKAAESGDVEGLALYGQDAVTRGLIKQSDLDRLTARAKTVQSRTDAQADYQRMLQSAEGGKAVQSAIDDGNFHLMTPEQRQFWVDHYGEEWVADNEAKSRANGKLTSDAAVAAKNYTLNQGVVAYWQAKLTTAKTPGDIALLPVLDKDTAQQAFSRIALSGGDLNDPALIDAAHKQGINLNPLRWLQTLDNDSKKLALDNQKWTIFDRYMQNPELAYGNPGAVQTWAKGLGLDPAKTLTYFKDMADLSAADRRAKLTTYRAQPELLRLQLLQGNASLRATNASTAATVQNTQQSAGPGPWAGRPAGRDPRRHQGRPSRRPRQGSG